MREKLINFLQTAKSAPVLPIDLSATTTVWLNLDDSNPAMETLKNLSVEDLSRFIAAEIEQGQGRYGIGGYDEDRSWYLRSPVFTTSDEPRTIHLGVDIWCAAGTPVSSPIDGEIHSFHDNSSFGDYGPTLITKHIYPDGEFYLLYGHLSRESLCSLTPGTQFSAGEKIAAVGESEENGSWPPHLHFQIVRKLGGMKGDYPGVARASERSWYLKNCPDPNLLLRAEALLSK